MVGQPAPPRLDTELPDRAPPRVDDPHIHTEPAGLPWRARLGIRDRFEVWFIVRKINAYMEGSMPQIIKNIWQSKGSTILGGLLGAATWFGTEFPGHHWVAVLVAVMKALSNDHGTPAK